MAHGSETWPMENEGGGYVGKNRMMLRWMRGSSLRDRISSEELKGIVRVTEVARCGRLVILNENIKIIGHLLLKL